MKKYDEETKKVAEASKGEEIKVKPQLDLKKGKSVIISKKPGFSKAQSLKDKKTEVASKLGGTMPKVTKMPSGTTLRKKDEVTRSSTKIHKQTS